MIKKLSSKKVSLIILANDIGNSQRKKFLDKANFYDIPVLFYKTKEELASLLHKGSVSSLAILDKNLANAIKKEKEDSNE